MPRRSVDEVLLALQSRNILTTSGEEPPGWLPLRDLDKVSAKELLDTVRAAGEDQYMCPDLLPDSDAVRQLMRRCDEATEAALLEVSVKDLVWKLPERPRLTEP